MRMSALPTTIHPSAIAPIMAVAVKYVPEVRNRIENPGNIPKKDKRNVIMTIPPI